MEASLALVQEFHKKFHAPILDSPQTIPTDRSTLRYRLMKEEVEEYLVGTEKKDIANIAKELADILYTVYGTILEHGLQDKMPEIFQEVHRSNMSKDYHEKKMIKGTNYVPANIEQFLT